ncbi:MAG: hypothetical protein L0287_05185 [Anaerolineae bacterium]|nr:hypothetical protein [Anaerolineae bacterium]
MPLVDIEIILKSGETIQSELIRELADQLGEIFASPPRTTWVKVHGLPERHYAENGGKPDGVYPIFVSVVKSKLLPPDEMQKEVDGITGAVAQIYGRSSENVHVLYEPEGKGRVAFGGKIVP